MSNDLRSECLRAERRWAYAMRHGKAGPDIDPDSVCQCGARKEVQAEFCRPCSERIKGERRRAKNAGKG